MSELPRAEVSPRIDNCILRWYEGDTFSYDLCINLMDDSGDTVNVSSSGTVTVTFRNRKNEIVKTFTFTNVENNMVSMTFDSTCTALFPKGSYTYDVFLDDNKRTTIGSELQAIVE